MRLSDLKASFPDFQEIYRSHFQPAKFNNILRLESDLETRKLRLFSVQYLLATHPCLRPERRTQLVQSLLTGDFDNAQSILREPKWHSAVSTLVTSTLKAFLPPPSDGGTSRSLKREMKSLAAQISDSEFLLKMKDVNDEVLQPMIQELESLFYSLLSSIIDTTSDTMARAVVARQLENFETNLQHQIESRERRLQAEELIVFIKKLNILSAGRRDWYVVSDLSCRG